MILENRFSKGIIILLLAGQIAFSFAFLLVPKPAQAFLGIGDITFNTEIGNVYDIMKDIGLAAAQRIAIQFANKYIQQFVDKLIDKYRIKDYLAYDKVLSGYYLNQYIYNNVDDPDLRAIDNILATNISGRVQYTDPQTGQKKPALVALREKLDTYYYGLGGIDSNRIFYPGTYYKTDQDYFAAAQAYFANPPDFSRQQVYEQYAKLQDQANAASNQEIASSNGLKNDRSPLQGVIAHKCNNFDGTWADYLKDDPRGSQTACTAAGGTWVVDGNGLISSVIQNPSGFIHDFATASINQIFQDNFGLSDNIYTQIGSLLGDFLFKQMTLGSGSGTLEESNQGYIPPGSGSQPSVTNIDIDGDGISDVVQDSQGNQSCIYGGIPIQNADGSTTSTVGPPCLGSKAALSTPPAPSPTSPTTPTTPTNPTTPTTPSGNPSLKLVISGSGSVTDGSNTCNANTTPCSFNYSAGASITLTATNGANAFASWAGDCTGTTNPCTLTISGTRNVTATFQ